MATSMVNIFTRIICIPSLFICSNIVVSAELSDDVLMPEKTVFNAAEAQRLPYQTPSKAEWITATPGNLLSFFKRIHPVDNVWWLTGIGLSTAVLMKYDQQIIDESQRFATRLGLISDTKSGRETYTIVDSSVGGFELPLLIPKNLNSTMYFIGDGITHLGIVGGLLTYGMMNNDSRSLSTASQVMEALILTGIIVQVIKRSTGHEAPFTATTSGGRWDFFPNQNDYNENVPQYDAFPSGHVATVMATVTVLAENYPEHKYIRPVGYGAMGLVGFAMLNNGVHWASDYPMGIAIGYVAARVSIERNRKQRWLKANKISAVKGLEFMAMLPMVSGDRLGLTYMGRF